MNDFNQHGRDAKMALIGLISAMLLSLALWALIVTLVSPG